MRTAPDIADLAQAVLPDWCRHRIVALLHAYFDESGTHRQYGKQITAIAGFIGPAEEWRLVKPQWLEVMKGEVFHYKEMRMEGERLAKLATILASSKLRAVSGAFAGDWERAISKGEGWKRRLPSCYHLLFELCVEQMDKYSRAFWDNEPIAVMFSSQNEYAKRAENVWRTMKGNGFWQNIVSFTYGDPKIFAELQTADMIVHEVFQGMKQGTFANWPLVSRLLAKTELTLYGASHTEETFIAMMEKVDREGRQYLRRVSET